MSAAIITEGSLSLLGLGVQPPTPSWGHAHRRLRLPGHHPLVGPGPGVATMVTVLAFNFVGDAVRDAYDPRLRERPRA